MEFHLRPIVDDDFTRINIEKYSRANFGEANMVSNDVDLIELMKHHGIDPQIISKEVNSLKRYLAKTFTGATKRNSIYSSCLNYGFQRPAAEGMRVAQYDVFKEAYKSVLVVHDELIVELPIDNNLQSSVKHIQELMIKGMRKVVKNTEIRCEPALMINWHKKAEAIYNRKGDLLIWTSETYEANDKEKKYDNNQLQKETLIKKANPVFTKAGELYGWKPIER